MCTVRSVRWRGTDLFCRRLQRWLKRRRWATTNDASPSWATSRTCNRSWSGFSNFAISFSIISILAGCFTNFGAGFNNGGPISISWTWPILGAFILIIGFTMSELVSAYPTSGGIYWWASKLGGAKAGFFTGWLNLIGLVAVTAGVSYGCATFIDLTISTYSDSYAGDYSLTRVFFTFLVVLVVVSVLNIFSSHLMAIMNNVSVWWHVVGATVDRADPDLRPRPAPVVQLRLHRAVQQLRLQRRQHHRASPSGSPSCRSASC